MRAARALLALALTLMACRPAAADRELCVRVLPGALLRLAACLPLVSRGDLRAGGKRAARAPMAAH